jgi:hypothetical protein
MTLKSALDAFRAEFLAKFPADKAAIMQRATDQLAQNYATRTGLQVSDYAPNFELPNAVGEQVKLSNRLQHCYSHLLSRRLVPLLQFRTACLSANFAPDSSGWN